MIPKRTGFISQTNQAERLAHIRAIRNFYGPCTSERVAFASTGLPSKYRPDPDETICFFHFGDKELRFLVTPNYWLLHSEDKGGVKLSSHNPFIVEGNYMNEEYYDDFKVAFEKFKELSHLSVDQLLARTIALKKLQK
jgi:hypothetical protein